MPGGHMLFITVMQTESGIGNRESEEV